MRPDVDSECLAGSLQPRMGALSVYIRWMIRRDMPEVLNLAVAPTCRRLGVAGQMIRKLKGNLSNERRRQILCDVRETNLAAQLFLHSQGFRAVNVFRGFYEHTAEDAYRFRYRLAAS